MIRGKRKSGILLHITSLPSNYGIGDLGPESYQFTELLSRCKQRCWSILPLNPTTIKRENSPYITESVFAGNTLIISPDILAQEGFIQEDYLKLKKYLPQQKVNYREAQITKNAVLKKAYRNYKGNSKRREDNFNTFCSQEDEWLEDYSLYKALRNKSRKPWYLWPDPLRNREPKVLAQKTKSLSATVQYEKFAQYIFFNQWNSLRDYCKNKEVRIIGDLPFYLDYDSADVWSHPELYELDGQKKPRYVSGVPPDYFSKTGQLWGNPVYNWKKHEETCFEWWIKRIKHNLRFCDALRLDHFRGFIAYWQVPALAKTAEKGTWTKVPKSFFKTLKKNFPSLPFIAEDLGEITEDVIEARKRLGIPGMRVLVFAFNGKKDNPHFPKNHIKNAVAYTGTHDTNTVKGWFSKEATPEDKKNLFCYIGKKVSKEKVSKEFVNMAMASKANLCIIPLQDILGLGAKARMNIPAQQRGNWKWRVTKEQLTSKELDELGELTKKYNRE